MRARARTQWRTAAVVAAAAEDAAAEAVQALADRAAAEAVGVARIVRALVPVP